MARLIDFLLMMSLLCAAYGYSSTFYSDNDLGQTVPIGKIDKRQKKELQQEMLELMGLYSKPKRLSKEKAVQSASEFMRKLYKSLTDGDAEVKEGADDSHIHLQGKVNASALGLDPSKVEGCDVIVSFVNKANQISHLRHEKDRTFYFDFSEVSVGEQLKGAELRLYKEISEEKYTGRSFVITLYRIKQGRDWEDKVLVLEAKKTVEWDTNGWLALDVTPAAEDWTMFPYSNMGLYLKVTDSYGHEYDPRSIGLVDRWGATSKLPFLVGYMQMSQDLLSRRTRSIRNQRWAQTGGVTYDHNPYTVYSRHKRSYPQYVSNTVCQIHNLYINFTDIGLNREYLIAPEGYRAFYCAGQCSFPLGIHMNSTNHAIVQTLVHLLKPDHVPKPCCAPTKFGSITLLYHDNKASILIRQFKEMTVKACGCH